VRDFVTRIEVVILCAVAGAAVAFLAGWGHTANEARIAALQTRVETLERKIAHAEALEQVGESLVARTAGLLSDLETTCDAFALQKRILQQAEDIGIGGEQ